MNVLFHRNPQKKLKSVARKVYNYHNLGAGIFPEGEEKTPFGSGERYNFDRMYMMVSNYDFTGKNLLDCGCNSGWFTIQAKLLGTAATVGIDFDGIETMGPAIRYAIEFEKVHHLGITFINADLRTVRLQKIAREAGIAQFDVSLLLSTLHHLPAKDSFFSDLYELTREVIFYEDHEFWNELTDETGNPIPVKGTGHRFGWNEDMAWQRKIHSIDWYEPRILESFRSGWRGKTLMMDQFKCIRFLGFSEKRRPMLAMFKPAPGRTTANRGGAK